MRKSMWNPGNQASRQMSPALSNRSCERQRADPTRTWLHHHRDAERSTKDFTDDADGRRRSRAVGSVFFVAFCKRFTASVSSVVELPNAGRAEPQYSA